MDPGLKNLRDWVLLLFVLFCVLDIAGVQYGMRLVENSPDHPEPALGQIVALVYGQRDDSGYVYITERQSLVFYGFLGASGVALMGSLGIVIAHGMRMAYAERRPARSRQRKRHD